MFRRHIWRYTFYYGFVDVEHFLFRDTFMPQDTVMSVSTYVTSISVKRSSIFEFVITSL